MTAAYLAVPKLGELSPVRTGLCTSNNGRYLRRHWELVSVGSADPRWVPYVTGGRGLGWMDPCDDRTYWASNGLDVKVYNEFLYGSFSRTVQNEPFYNRYGISYTAIGNRFIARAFRRPAIMGKMGSSVFPDDMASTLCAMNSPMAREVLSSLNPGLHFEVGDVNRLPYVQVPDASEIFRKIIIGFVNSEVHRECSIEFVTPGPSSWRYTQEWAQRAVDRSEHEPLPQWQPVYDLEQMTERFSFALGVSLGRFGADGEGVLESAPPTALPHGVLFLSDASDHDSLVHSAAAPILAAWEQHGPAIDDQRTLKAYLQERFFPDVHRKMYENRPIYFPLSSEKKSFVAYVSIHRWTASTLNDLLAEHLYPAKRRLEGEQTDLRPARDGADKKAAKEAEKRLGQIAAWLEELGDFIARVEQCAENGPPPPDGKTRPREVDARYEMDLDDGVMINSAALWPVLEPQWKDPKKWWKELATAEGKKDYDWAHLARRYFPNRVDAKCKLDPSLAVAHGCFWKYHPEKAYQWELRLQDEIRPDFTIDEVGSDAARAAFEAKHPEKVEELVAKEQQRRLRKQAKAGQAEDSDDSTQRTLDLDAAGNDDAESDVEEELSA